jgi:hypothetical protein
MGRIEKSEVEKMVQKNGIIQNDKLYGEDGPHTNYSSHRGVYFGYTSRFVTYYLLCMKDNKETWMGKNRKARKKHKQKQQNEKS